MTTRSVTLKTLSIRLEIIISVLAMFLCAIAINHLHNNTFLIFPFIIIVATLFIIGCVFPQKAQIAFNALVKYRYLVALAIFIICVIFQLHGSSVNHYNNYFTDLPFAHDTLFGEARALRSDEYNVQLPYYFSQYYNDYQLMSNQMSISGQNMIIGYNSPVLDITILSKPFTWGYILLGNSYGLAWYWSMKLILCILSVFELFMIITKKHPVISIVMAFMLVFSPAMQWWFSPHMYDVFFWAVSLCVVGYHFFISSGKFKWFFTILAGFTVPGFVLALFPSLQVIAGLTVIALLIGLLIRDKAKIVFAKKDIFKLALAIVIAGSVIGYFVLVSFDEIIKLYSTAYPGERISVGGDSSFHHLFTNLTNFFTPYKASNVLNDCEVSSFIHVGVLFLISFPYLFFKRTKESKRDLIVGAFLFFTMLVQIEFMLIGMPETLAKITLFSYINRMAIAYGFTATISSCWLIYYLTRYKAQHNKLVIFALTAVFMAAQYIALTPENMLYMPWYFYAGIILLFGAIIVCVPLKKYRLAITLSLLLSLFSSGTVNPIAYGTDAIYGHSISKEIAKISQETDSFWIATESTMTQNFLLANGAKVMNSVNFYPDVDKWDLIDPSGASTDSYNRYAHCEVVLTDDNSQVMLNFADSLTVLLNVNSLESLDVKYILTGRNLADLFNNNGIEYEIVYADISGYMIYELTH